jgi:hypothetical protein
MKKTIATLLTLFLALACVAQAPAERYVASDGVLSIRPPAGWIWQAREGSKYKSAFGPASDVFRANLNFQDEMTAISLDDYADACIEHILKTYEKLGATNAKRVSRTEIVTDSKERGIKVAYLCEYKGLQINSVQYLFDTGKKKLIATFTALEAEKAVNDRIFDAAIKTFEIVR